MVSILIERRRTNHAQLTSGEHRLDHVAGIHRAFGTTCADERVDLIDEGDDVTLCVGDLLQHRLQSLFELTAILRAREHRRKIERDQALTLQSLGDVAVVDASCESFDNGRFAHSRFADENGIVLRATRQHLDHAANLLVATDDRVDLAVACTRRQVHAVLLQRLELALGVL